MESQQFRNVSQFVEAKAVNWNLSLVPRGAVMYDEEPAVPVRADMEEAGYKLLQKLLVDVENVKQSVDVIKLVTVAAQGNGRDRHTPRGPYRKEYGPGMKEIFIEDANGAYAKWLKIPSASRPALDGYLLRELDLKEWTLKRRLREHQLRLQDLPWSQT